MWDALGSIKKKLLNQNSNDSLAYQFPFYCLSLGFLGLETFLGTRQVMGYYSPMEPLALQRPTQA